MLSTLEADFGRRSGELLTSGLCWHTMRSCAAEEREMREAARPGSLLTVLEYPEQLEDVPVRLLWDAVIRPTEWECVDEVREGGLASSARRSGQRLILQRFQPAPRLPIVPASAA